MEIRQIIILRRSVVSLLILSLFFLGQDFLKVIQGIPSPTNNVSQVSTVVEKDFNNENSGERITGDWKEVSRVIDGDTVEVTDNFGAKQKIRLIGINTPETVDPRRTVQCFGKEASTHAKEILIGKQVRVETDPSQGKLDKYGRLLAYVFLEDGALFNKKIIEDGYAYEYTYRVPYRYQKEFKEAETLAKNERRGLWAPRVCGN